MGYNVKLGKGGHGLEVYDEEGKYASDFSFNLDDGTPISNYKDFRLYCFGQMIQQEQMDATPDDLESYYQNNIQARGQIDAMLLDNYNEMVSNAVDLHNAQQVWDTPEEAAKHLDELFVPSLVQNLIDNNILTTDVSSVTEHYSVATFAACVQMSRYKRNRANIISKQEFEDRCSKCHLPTTEFDSYTDVIEFRDFVQRGINDNLDIYVNRGISTYFDESKEIFRSFYDENSPRHSCLSENGTGYLGSVIYAAMGNYEGYGGGLRVKGLVNLNKDLKLLECPLTQWEAGRSKCNNSIPEIGKFRVAINSDPDFKNKMLTKFKEGGNLSDSDAEIIYEKFTSLITSDPGFCAMLMGYDAIYGCSYHFDILNLGIWDIVEQ